MFGKLFGKSIRMPVLAVVMLDLHVMSLCPENQFEVQILNEPSCCDFCPEGRYVSVNCTKKGHEYVGVRCGECTKCADGMQTIAPCTHFSNTKCGEIVTAKLTTTTTTEGTPPMTPGKLAISYTALYITAPVIFIIIIITVVVYIWCIRRSISHDPAKEPFNIII